MPIVYKTKEDYRRAWKNSYEVDPAIPLNIDIELASVCNLECPFCFIADKKFDSMIREKAADGKTKRRLMPKELAFRIIDACASLGVPALKMNWRGESTLHPDYSEILHYAATRVHDQEGWASFGVFAGGLTGVPRFCEILVNTNANCSDAAIDGLMAATKVMVSLDSLVPATYAVMRAGGSLERAKEVVKELIRKKHPNLWVRRVLTKENKAEPFFKMVRDEFGDWPKVSEHYCFDRNAASKHSGYGHDLDMERTYCGYPSQRIVISSTGLCYPCCIDLHEAMPIGDINKQSLAEIWNGDLLRKLREQLRDNQFKSEACKNCQSWMSFKTPQREYVQDKEINA